MRKTPLLMAAAGMFLIGHAAEAQTGDRPSPTGAPKSEERLPPSPMDAGTASDETDRPDAVSPRESPPARRGARADGAGDRPGPRRDRDRMLPPPPSKAAEFRIENGPLRFHVKCAEDEPMQACADIASRLLGQAMGTASR